MSAALLRVPLAAALQLPPPADLEGVHWCVHMWSAVERTLQPTRTQAMPTKLRRVVSRDLESIPHARWAPHPKQTQTRALGKGLGLQRE